MSHPPILEEFLELVQLDVHSRQERQMADALKNKLENMGFTVEEDGTGEKIGGNCGSLIARLPGNPNKPSILFSAHMDRVENHGHIKPQVIEAEDVIRSDGTSILAADDVTGICVILDGVRRALAEKVAHGDIEIVFSVAEEVGLLGARYLDYSKLKSKMAYVLDTGGPVGTIVNQAPTQYMIYVKVHGKSAHAGMEPEKGINAIKVAACALAKIREGRLSPTSTANFGIIQGGKASNIVCDLVNITGETRSTNPDELPPYLEEVKKVFAETAAEWNTTIEVDAQLEYSTFRVDEKDETIQLAVRAMKNMGIEANIVSSGGGMDGNFFNNNGIKAIGISPDMSNAHTPQEEQSISGMIRCGQLVTEIIKEAAAIK